MGGESNTLRAEEWKATTEVTWEEDLDPQERQGASVGEGRGGAAGHQRILLAPQRVHLPAS